MWNWKVMIYGQPFTFYTGTQISPSRGPGILYQVDISQVRISPNICMIACGNHQEKFSRVNSFFLLAEMYLSTPNASNSVTQSIARYPVTNLVLISANEFVAKRSN